MWVSEQQLSDDVIFNELTEQLTREHIISQSTKNEEFPFGYVCDTILDNYPVTLGQNDRLTKRILKHFSL